MIRMTVKDALGAKELFGEHAAHQQVRPRHRPQGQDQIGIRDQIPIETFGTADEERQIADAAVAPTLQALGKGATVEGPAATVKGDDRRLFRDSAQQGRGLATRQLVGWRLSFRHHFY